MTETLLRYAPLSELARIRELPVAPQERAALFANVSRLNTLYMITRAGSGHIGTSFSAMDIVAWLFLEKLRRDGDRFVDTFFSSKGHDAPAFYAVQIGLGLLDFDSIHKLRRLGGLPGHPDVSTPLVHTNTGSLGMGISKAKGMIRANRLSGRDGRFYVLTGDGELQEGQFWESLQPAANAGLHELTVIVDHNKVQSDWLVERVSGLGDLEPKIASFGWAVRRADGHDIEAFGRALDELERVEGRPKLLIADTVKGKGVSFMEHTSMAPDERLYHFHSGGPNAGSYQRGAQEVYRDAAVELLQTIARQLEAVGAAPLATEAVPFPARTSPSRPQNLVNAYGRALVEQAQRNPRVVALDADLAKDCGLLEFETRFPDRFFEHGIAEQDMVSAAGGMALRGLLPTVHSFACFLTTRPNEQIYNNATERTKIVYVGSLAGLLPAGPGHSHQSVRDISAVGGMPNMVMLQPCTEAETVQAVDYCLNGTRESCYLRLVSIPVDVPFELPNSGALQEGIGVELTGGEDVVVFTYGPVMLTQMWHSVQSLAERGVRAKLVNLPWLNRVDLDWLRQVVGTARLVVTVDDHYVLGGQGQFLASQIAGLGLERAPRVVNLGVQRIPLCGTNDEVLRAHGLDADSLVLSVGQLVDAGRPSSSTALSGVGSAALGGHAE